MTGQLNSGLLRSLCVVAILYLYGMGDIAWADEPPVSAGQGTSAQPAQQSGETTAQGEVEIGGVDWIKGQPASSYTLQLMAASSPAALKRLVRDKSIAAPLAIAANKADGSGLYLLFQGSYGRRSEAESAATQIEEMSGVQPWVRLFSSLANLYDATAAAAKQSQRDKANVAETINGAAWLWSHNPGHYTVQLMSDNQRERLRRVVEHKLPGLPVAIVEVRLKGKAWYLLLAGDYENAGDAQQLIDSLPEPLRRAKPWPRSFASLQEQMARANHTED